MKEGPIKVSAFINAYTSGVSGGDVRFVEIFRRLQGVETTVITPEQGVKFCEERKLSANYVRTSGHDSSSSVLFSYPLRTIRAIMKLRDRELGVLYASSDFLPDVLPCFILRKKATRWVQLIHHLIPSPRKREGSLMNNTLSFLMQRLSLIFIKMKADSVVVVSEGVRQSLIGMGIEASKIHVNPNGVDLAFYDGLAATESGYDGAFLARLHRSKGIFDLVKIWGQVCDQNPDAKLAIIGGGDESITEELSASIASNGLQDNIALLGFLPRDQAFGVLKSSKVFLFPSHEEGFGIAILEAMACGLPTIGWDLPVYRDVFRTGGMISAPMGEHGTFAQMVNTLLHDEEERGRLSGAARLTAQRFDWEKIAEREKSLLE